MMKSSTSEKIIKAVGSKSSRTVYQTSGTTPDLQNNLYQYVPDKVIEFLFSFKKKKLVSTVKRQPGISTWALFPPRRKSSRGAVLHSGTSTSHLRPVRATHDTSSTKSFQIRSTILYLFAFFYPPILPIVHVRMLCQQKDVMRISTPISKLWRKIATQISIIVITFPLYVMIARCDQKDYPKFPLRQPSNWLFPSRCAQSMVGASYSHACNIGLAVLLRSIPR